MNPQQPNSNASNTNNTSAEGTTTGTSNGGTTTFVNDFGMTVTVPNNATVFGHPIRDFIHPGKAVTWTTAGVGTTTSAGTGTTTGVGTSTGSTTTGTGTTTSSSASTSTSTSTAGTSTASSATGTTSSAGTGTTTGTGTSTGSSTTGTGTTTAVGTTTAGTGTTTATGTSTASTGTTSSAGTGTTTGAGTSTVGTSSATTTTGVSTGTTSSASTVTSTGTGSSNGTSAGGTTTFVNDFGMTVTVPTSDLNADDFHPGPAKSWSTSDGGAGVTANASIGTDTSGGMPGLTAPAQNINSAPGHTTPIMGDHGIVSPDRNPQSGPPTAFGAPVVNGTPRVASSTGRWKLPWRRGANTHTGGSASADQSSESSETNSFTGHPHAGMKHGDKTQPMGGFPLDDKGMSDPAMRVMGDFKPDSHNTDPFKK